jgi:phosphoserine phosphatase RsbU/P
MQGDLLIEDDGAVDGTSRTGARFTRKDVLGADAASAPTIESQDVAKQYERLRTANARLRALHKEFEEDLAVAARVQQHLEPRPTVWGRVRVDTFSQPARTIGGDFGVVSCFDDRHLNLLLGDVSGHGISAALAASRIFAETSQRLQTGAPLGQMLSTLNRFALQTFNCSSFFFTVAAARLARCGRRLVFAGAGHPPCMVIKPGMEPKLLESRSMILGALPNAVCDEATIEMNLEPGDRIFLYTDGITDVFDEQGKMLGTEGLRNFVRESPLLPFAKMLPNILRQIAAGRRGPFIDDVTLILAEVLE